MVEKNLIDHSKQFYKLMEAKFSLINTSLYLGYDWPLEIFISPEPESSSLYFSSFDYEMHIQDHLGLKIEFNLKQQAKIAFNFGLLIGEINFETFELKFMSYDVANLK